MYGARVHAGVGGKPARGHRAAARAREALLGLGPLMEQHDRFPDRTNVQLVRVENAHEITVRVWERGVGETQSSGPSPALQRPR